MINVNFLKDELSITSENYVLVDTDAYRYSESVLCFKDMYYLNSMIHEIDTDLNLVYDSVLNNPYNITDLATKFKTQRNTIYRSFKRMQSLNIIFISKMSTQQIIIINPTLARKQKILKASTMKIFTDLSILKPYTKD